MVIWYRRKIVRLDLSVNLLYIFPTSSPKKYFFILLQRKLYYYIIYISGRETADLVTRIDRITVFTAMFNNGG